MRYIQLSNGKQAVVDDSDFKRVSRHKWSFDGDYAHRMDGNRRVYLHRFIMGEPKSLQVDHKDLDKLNCRRSNLRVGTHADNCANKGLQSNNTSGVKGVCWYKDRKKWVARIKVAGRYIQLGGYGDKREAAKAYNKAALEYFGEFARLNLI